MICFQIYKKIGGTACLFAGLVTMLSCEKDYSYEGGNSVPVVVIPVDTADDEDTVIVDPGALPSCAACTGATDIPLSSWSFNTIDSKLCGQVDTAFVLNLERSTFTFFGPSFCGADTGLVFTVSLNGRGFTQDLQNEVAGNAVFYYYNTNRPYILLSHADQSFTFIISEYSHSTKIATGTFSGTGFRVDGRAVNVSNGRFKFRIV